MKWIMLTLVIIGLAIGLASRVFAQTTTEVHPSDYFWQEAVGGSVGMAVGGFGTSILIENTLQNCGIHSGDLCKLPGYLGLFIGGPVGTAVAVSLVAGWYGVRGNLGAAMLGSVGGLFGFTLVAIALGLPDMSLPEDWPVELQERIKSSITLSLFSISTGIGATIGFNLDAKFGPQVD